MSKHGKGDIAMSRPKNKTNAQIKNDYAKKAYDRVGVLFKKGFKAEIQSHAETQGESVNGFINRAVRETMERDKVKMGDAT